MVGCVLVIALGIMGRIKKRVLWAVVDVRFVLSVLEQNESYNIRDSPINDELCQLVKKVKARKSSSPEILRDTRLYLLRSNL